MWRKRPQENNDDGDSSKNQTTTTRRSLSIDASSSHDSSSRYEIGHGSSDYNGYVIPSPAGTGSSGLDSPGSEGLHHRKAHHHAVVVHPVQQAAAILTNMSTSHANNSTNHVMDLQHPLATTTMQRTNYRGGGIMAAGGHNNINSTRAFGRSNHNQHHPGLLLRGNKQNIASSAWKKLAKCFFFASLLGYVAFLYLAQNHYRKKGEQPSSYGQHNYDGLLPGQFDKGSDANHHLQSTLSWKDKRRQQYQLAQEDRSTLGAPLPRPLGDMHDYIFKPAAAAGHKSPQQQLVSENSVPASQYSIHWSSNSLLHAKQVVDRRRKNRRQRTIPPKINKQSNSIPLWYELHHSTEDTILSLHSRWKEANDDSTSAAMMAAIDPSMLCGMHAQKAAKHHPQNYLISGKPLLGPQSRVLISGILSPLGLHLTIALHRQCGVINFLGLDTMFPNDPFSRLEYQERLAVLMEELGETVELQVPFLGLESKQSGEQTIPDRLAWNELLVELRAMSLKNNTTAFANDADDLSAPTSRQYIMPFAKYGISPTPGTARDGSGPLNAILHYRPTHIVHLAGTQSDSLLNSNNRRENDDLSPHENTIFRNKDEEEDGILKESISSRPHLYDLRMGVVGMEQLLSAAVAQMMLPPTVGPSSNSVLSDDDLDNMTKPHIVYASTYDALLFRDTAARLRQEDKKKVLEYENLGSTSMPQPKRPPRGLHGVSRLIDEVISSSYHSLHNIPSIGLRFDVIYGPRGFGVSSASVPIFHADRRLKRGISADVDLAETAVKRLYRKWTDAVNANAEKEETEEEEDGEGEDSNEREERGRRLEEARHVNLLEETGWIHSAHDRRDFVFVEGERPLPSYH